MEVPDVLLWVIYIFAVLFGLVIGSFLNVCIYRLPEGPQLWKPPRSFCPSCRRQIDWYDNIPILSYFILRGRCRSCGARISPRYPAVEALSALAAAANLYAFGPSAQAVIFYLFTCALVVITFIDVDYKIIPDVISIPGIVIGLALSPLLPATFVESLIGAAVGGGVLYGVILVYYLLTKREGMGMGDVKLLAMIGAFLGWKSLPFVLLVSSFTGTLVGVGLMILARKDRRYAVPFGPFLSLGAVSYLFFGDPVIAWYLAI